MFSIYLTEAVHNLYTARQRTLLALLGIIIGIGSMIGQVSISMIKGDETLREFSQMGTDIMFVFKDYSDDDEGQNVQISLTEALELPHYVPNVVTVAPVMQSYGGEYHFVGETGEANILGVDASLRTIYNLQLTEGRFLSSLDDGSLYVVIGCEVLQMPGFKDFKGKLLGTGIKLNNSVFVIIGVLKCTADSAIGLYDIDWSILLSISTLQRQSHLTEISRLIVRRAPDTNYLLVSAQIKQYFAKRVKGLKVRVGAVERWIKHQKNEVQRTTLLSVAIGGLSLLAGSIGIMNVMLTAVIERRREIGILRAIGARQRDIRWQFLLEAMILSLIGGFLGSGLGITVAYLIAWWNEWQFFVSYQVLLLGVGVSWGVGIFFGFYPAYKAARLDPIVALRTE